MGGVLEGKGGRWGWGGERRARLWHSARTAATDRPKRRRAKLGRSARQSQSRSGAEHHHSRSRRRSSSLSLSLLGRRFFSRARETLKSPPKAEPICRRVPKGRGDARLLSSLFFLSSKETKSKKTQREKKNWREAVARRALARDESPSRAEDNCTRL